MKALFIGGTGVISSACAELAVREGMDLTLLNRGRTERPVPGGAKSLRGDINDPAIAKLLAGHTWDVVVEWVAYTPEHVQRDINLFRGRTGQYIFISSASVYQTPPSRLPVTESTLLDNPFWGYAQQKIACEELLVQAYRDEKYPMTIVRPSHTYDQTKIPLLGGYTTLHRMRQGKKVIVQGDGTSLWTLTHQKDFAKGFVPVLGHSGALGEAIHITSDEWLTWNQIYEIMAELMDVNPRLVHIPSEFIATFDREIGAGLLGDKSHSMIFDNSKIKRLVPDFACSIPFSRGAREIVDWYTADPVREAVDEQLNGLLDRIIAAYEAALPKV